MKPITPTNGLVQEISNFLQDYMEKNKIHSMSADECAELLDRNNILSSSGGPKNGFNFREVLRWGRDGKVEMVEGVHQERPNTKWIIKCAPKA